MQLKLYNVLTERALFPQSEKIKLIDTFIDKFNIWLKFVQ